MSLVDLTNPTNFPIGSPPWQRALQLPTGIAVEQEFDKVMSFLTRLQTEMTDEGRFGKIKIPAQLAPGGYTERAFTFDDLRLNSRVMMLVDAVRVVWVFCSAQFTAQEERIQKLESEIAELRAAVRALQEAPVRAAAALGAAMEGDLPTSPSEA